SAYALETAMDELAYKLKMDPLEFRLLNWVDQGIRFCGSSSAQLSRRNSSGSIFSL
ncbi:hypothetical protein EON77_14800, partial [bacterium]